ncbi:12372_t:CDS:2 [Ambispora gerdemannii]|uniref:12372_t:CDS:1 n=1 Tax=Ambispora gerdemannii TaxID=144530 RepID=A0A9N8V2A2_9GLOM|nr:12372_t:CDS:2 [Ambispora gerdemannii]
MDSLLRENDVTPNKELAIEALNLNYSFGGPLILQNLHLELHKGSRCLLVGANGAGKSTLLTILAGKRMVRDKVNVFGKNAFRDTPSGVTYLGTEWANNPVVRGDVLVSTLLSNMNGDRYVERRDKLLEIMDINPNWRMHLVSDGERRRVQLVLGLIQPWDLLLLDEVTVDLDVLVRSDFHLCDFSQLYRIPFKSPIEGLGDWPTHVAHIKRGAIVALHDFYNDFPELDKMITKSLELRTTNEKDTQSSSPSTAHLRRDMDSPLLKVVEQWLRQDFIELRQLKDGEKKKNQAEQDKVLLGEELPRTNWDGLSDNMKIHGDKYYNYWR